MATAKELRAQSAEELKAMYQDLSKELFSLQNGAKAAREGFKPHQKKEIRRNRARVLTTLREMGITVS